MNQTLETILSRRSIRRFEAKEIPEAVLNDLLEAARWAPSWGNTQCWEIIVVKDREQKEKLAAVVGEKNPAIPAVRQAPVVLAICGATGRSGFYKGRPVTKFGEWFFYDLGIATQNIILAAHALGLGSVIVGALDHDLARGILNLPESLEVVTLLPLGYPAQTPAPPKRRKVEEFRHLDRFSGS